MATDRTNIGYKFENGDIPSQGDFQEVFNSFVHKDEDKANFQMVETGTDDQHYVTPALLRTGLQNIGIITGNSYMPLKEYFNNFIDNSLRLDKPPVNYSVKVFKNGQLLLEGKDYTINYDTAVITFAANIDNRNIEVDYWYKNLSPNPGGGSGQQIDFTSFLHTSGNETKNGILTFNNTTPTSTSGIVLTNSGADTGAKVLDVTVSGAGSGVSVQNTAAGTGIKLSNTGAGTGVHLNSSAAATGDPLKVTKDNVIKAKIDSEGIVTAKRFVSEEGTDAKFVKGDGSLDPTTYADDTKVLHRLGNESKDGELKLTHDTSADTVLTITKNNSANCLKLVQNSSSNATTSTIDTSTDNVNRKAISIRKKDVEKAFITHDGNVSGTSFTTLNEKADITDGFLTLAGSAPSDPAPTATAGHAKLYAKTAGTTDFYVMGSDGVEKKIGGEVDLSAYAKIESPSFTGVPTVPTAALGTNTNQIASTAFVLANSSSNIPHLESDNTNKTVWNNGQSNIDTNTSFGENALKSDTTGYGNTAIGNNSLPDNTTGLANTAIGTSALRSNIEGSENTAVGFYSLMNCKGSKNTAIGKNAGSYLSTGDNNIFIGRETGSGITTGSGNVIIGDYSTNAANLTNNIIIANGVGHTKARHDGTNWTLTGNVTSNGFTKSGGTASQFLKADGSIDNNTYLTSSSPALLGVPTAPTASVGTNTTQIATTAFVAASNNNYVDKTTIQSIGGYKTFTNGVTVPYLVTTETYLQDRSLGFKSDGVYGYDSNSTCLVRQNGHMAIKSVNSTGRFARLNTNLITTSDKTFTFPDKDGTIALLSDLVNIPSSGSFSAVLAPNSSNVTGITIITANYTKIGNIVNVQFAVNLNIVAGSTNSFFEIEAPFFRAGVIYHYYIGQGTVYSTGLPQGIPGQAYFLSNNQGYIRFLFTSETGYGPRNVTFNCQYDVTK